MRAILVASRSACRCRWDFRSTHFPFIHRRSTRPFHAAIDSGGTSTLACSTRQVCPCRPLSSTSQHRPSWTLARSVVADGGVSSLSLREGGYQVQAAPSGRERSRSVGCENHHLAQATPLVLTCPPKVKRFGQVLGPDGRPVGANFQILARASPTGSYLRGRRSPPDRRKRHLHLVADAGAGDSRSCRRGHPLPAPSWASFSTERPGRVADGAAANLGCPACRRHRPWTLSPGGADALVANAMVNFFSVDADGHSVFLGGSRTDAQDITTRTAGRRAAGP